MGNRSRFRSMDVNPRLDDEWIEYQLVENGPVRIYSVSGTLLREYPDVCETAIPESDREMIYGQVMKQCRESDVAFSKKDLLFAAEYQFSEIRLVGRMFLFSMKPRGAGWPDPEVLARQYDEFMNSPDLVRTIQKASTTREVAENSWDPEMHILRLRNDIICKKIAERFQLEYRKDFYYRSHTQQKKQRALFP